MTSAEAYARYFELLKAWPVSGRTSEQWANLAAAKEEIERIRLLETIRHEPR